MINNCNFKARLIKKRILNMPRDCFIFAKNGGCCPSQQMSRIATPKTKKPVSDMSQRSLLKRYWKNARWRINVVFYKYNGHNVILSG